MKTNIITSGAIGLALSALLFAGCTSSQGTDATAYDANRDTTVQTQANMPILEADEMAEPELADYDFSDANVAQVSNQQLHDWMNEVDVALQDSEAAATEVQRENLEELADRAEDINEDLAALEEGDMNQPADPELVKDVLEVQVEVGEYAERI